MLKKTITYTDFNGEEQTEDFYFNLTKAEIAEMELSADGNSLREQIKRIVDSNDGAGIIREMKNIIKSSYGVRSADGKLFMKSPEAFAKFESSSAYSELFMQLATDAELSAEFINGLMPSDLKSKDVPSVPGFRPGYDPNYRPTPPVAGVPQMETEHPEVSPSQQPYDPSQDRGPQPQ